MRPCRVRRNCRVIQPRPGNGPTLFGPTFQATDRPTIQQKKCCNGMIRSLASVKSFI